MLDHVSGAHITFVDPRLHADAEGMITCAQRLIKLFEEARISKKKVVISVGSRKLRTCVEQG
jgi:transaldolase